MPVIEIDAKTGVKVEVEEVPPENFSPTVNLTRICSTISQVPIKEEKDASKNEHEEKQDKKKRGRKPGKASSKNIHQKRVALVSNESTSKGEGILEKLEDSGPRNRPLKKIKPAEIEDIGSFDSSCFMNTPKGLVDSLSRYFTPGI